jgi:hypothetical protein
LVVQCQLLLRLQHLQVLEVLRVQALLLLWPVLLEVAFPPLLLSGCHSNAHRYSLADLRTETSAKRWYSGEGSPAVLLLVLVLLLRGVAVLST